MYADDPHKYLSGGTDMDDTFYCSRCDEDFPAILEEGHFHATVEDTGPDPEYVALAGAFVAIGVIAGIVVGSIL